MPAVETDARELNGRHGVASGLAIQLNGSPVVRRPSPGETGLHGHSGRAREGEGHRVAIDTSGSIVERVRPDPLRGRAVGHPHAGDEGGMNDHRHRGGDARRRAGQGKLSVRRLRGEQAVGVCTAVDGGIPLGGRAAAVVEDVRQFRAEARGIDADVGVGHVEIQAVGAADEAVRDRHREPAVARQIRILLGRH